LARRCVFILFYFGSATVGGVLNAVSVQEYFLFKDSEILAKIQE
jgi:hypothetical protein